jgi:anti-sigma-K factor RskA
VSTHERDHGSAQSDCGHDAGAYVLDALEPEEAARFRRHLDACAICRDEVQRLREVVERLPLAAPQLAVPRSLRRRVMRGLHDAGAQGTGRHRAGRRPWRRAAPGAPFARASPAGALLAVALLAAGATYAGVKLTEGSRSHERVVRASVTPPAASAVVRVHAGRAELVVRGMPAPPAGKVYEVWLARAGRAPAATSALFDVAADGSAVVDVPGDIRGVSEVLVTPEPRGGSARPTHAPVISARLA